MYFFNVFFIQFILTYFTDLTPTKRISKRKSTDLTQHLKPNATIRKPLFKQIPIKMCLMGNSFTGKKTQAKLLSEQYKLKIYNLEELIKENFALLDSILIPIEDSTTNKTLRKMDIE